MNNLGDLFEIWHPYWNWECFKNGMWKNRRKEMNRIQQCANLLSSPVECEEAMIRAINEYPISAQQHLSKALGKRPWMGQSACCIALGATEEETRIAWNFYMTEKAQNKANKIADEVIAKWEQDNA
jgi:hypothetical protein